MSEEDKDRFLDALYIFIADMENRFEPRIAVSNVGWEAVGDGFSLEFEIQAHDYDWCYGEDGDES